MYVLCIKTDEITKRQTVHAYVILTQSSEQTNLPV